LGRRIPDHELLRQIGKGGFGQVWLARTVTEGFRALKIIDRSTFGNSGIFTKEFEALKTFESLSGRHEGLVNVLHVGRNDPEGYYYYVMELADDCVAATEIDPATYTPRTLKADLNKFKRLGLLECLRIGTALAGALEYLHEHGLIHRDIKPANVIFVDGKPKLADIGLLTVQGRETYVGTEGYIAPEGPGRQQSDIYALGKMLYEMLTGKDRFECPSPPPSITSEELALLQIITKATHQEPASRYATAKAFQDELRSLDSALNSKK
jgi:serine/threonine protein kinase